MIQRGMLLALRCRFRNARDRAGCSVIGTSCQRISRYGMRFFGINRHIGMNWLRRLLSRMLSSETQADRAQVAEPKALLSSENAWRGLSEMLKIDAGRTGLEDDQCSVGFICNNRSTVLLRDMQIPTTYEAEAMAMARRMQAAVRLSMAEAKHKSALTGLVINSVRSSRSQN